MTGISHSRVFLHLCLLAGLAVAQPLYSLIGANPEFLVAHRINRPGVWSFVFTLSLALPAALFGLYWIAGKVSGSFSHAVMLMLIFLLGSLVSLPALVSGLGLDGWVSVAMAALAGGITAWCYLRLDVFRQFLTLFSLAALVFPAYFLFFTPVSGLLGEVPDQVEGGRLQVSYQPPVFFLVFDELPLVSLLNSDLEIDAGRFPNFAALANDATFYLNHNTNSNSTLVSVPNMLSGNLPKGRNRGLPSLKNYPDNLFSLLGGTYEISAVEHGTRLCPEQYCGVKKPHNRLLLADTLVVLAHILVPPAWQEQLPAINNDWLNFAGPSTRASSTVQDTAYFKKTLNWNIRVAEVEEFLSKLDGREGRLQYFHAMLPHASWQFLPDGRQLTASPSGHVTGARPNDPKLPFKHMWHDSPDALRVARQRHLLQTAYVDTLVGRLIEKLKAQGVYEDSLLIITSDHGVSFQPGGARRDALGDEITEISAVPLFIKYPGNAPSGTSLVNAQLMDIVPTILDVLGAKGWDEMDGQSLVDQQRDEFRQKTVMFSGQETRHISRARHEELLRASVSRYTQTFGEDDFASLYSSGDQHGILNQDVSNLNILPGTGPMIVLENLPYLEANSPSSSILQLVITGEIQAKTGSHFFDQVAISVNGVIQAVTGVLNFPGHENTFETLLSPDAFSRKSSHVQAWFVKKDETGVSLLLTDSPDSVNYRLESDGDGWNIFINQQAFSVVRGEVPGWCGITPGKTQGTYNIGGWAADLEAGIPADQILAFVNGRFYTAIQPDRETRRSAEEFNLPGILMSAFRFPVGLDQGVDPAQVELRLFALSRDGEISELNYPTGQGSWLFKPNPKPVGPPIKNYRKWKN